VVAPARGGSTEGSGSALGRRRPEQHPVDHEAELLGVDVLGHDGRLDALALLLEGRHDLLRHPWHGGNPTCHYPLRGWLHHDQ
jgi:hypothetical protein